MSEQYPVGPNPEEVLDEAERSRIVDAQLGGLDDYLNRMESADTFHASQSVGNIVDQISRDDSFQKVGGLAPYFKGAVLGSLKNAEMADSYFGEVDADIQTIAAGDPSLVGSMRELISPAREVVLRRAVSPAGDPAVEQSRSELAYMLFESGRGLAQSIPDDKTAKSVHLLLLGVATGVCPQRGRSSYLHDARSALIK